VIWFCANSKRPKWLLENRARCWLTRQCATHVINPQDIHMTVLFIYCLRSTFNFQFSKIRFCCTRKDRNHNIRNKVTRFPLLHETAQTCINSPDSQRSGSITHCIVIRIPLNSFSTQHMKMMYFDWIISVYYFWTVHLTTGDYTYRRELYQFQTITRGDIPVG
jgi:hypothetical protein